MGGWGGGSTYYNDVWRSADNGTTWMEMNASAGWSARSYFSGLRMPDGSIVIMGGWDGSNGLNDTWRSTDKGTTWTEVNASAGWPARKGQSSVTMPDGSIVLMGGWNGGVNFMNDVWRSTDNGATWTQINASAGWSLRNVFSTVVMPDGSIVLMGGYNGGFMNDVWRLLPAGSSAKNPSHTYTALGNYTVTLQAYNAGGYNSTVKNGYIRVKWPAPTFTSITPASPWYQNATINYTITGTNFLAGNTSVTFRNKSGVYLNGTDAGVTSVTAIRINGTIHVPYDATAGAWNVSITVVYGGTIWKDSAFTIQAFPKPVFTSITPAGTWYRNATVNYSITGMNFQPGNTIVTFWNKSGVLLNASSGAGVTSVTTTKINGTIIIPVNASVITPYNITIATIDGGTGGRDAAITVLPFPAPAITSFTPVTGYKNTTVSFTLNGNNFQIAGGYTNITLVNEYTSEMVYGAVSSATSTTITGTFVVPAGSTGGTYDLLVTTVDGGSTSKAAAFTLNNLPLPTISAINQTAGYRNTTVPFTITGTNFQPGAGGTYVRINSTAGPPVLATLSSVTGTIITGTFAIPYNAVTGLYRLDLLTTSGGSASKLNAFTVNPMPAPVISSVSPASSFRNRTFVLTVTGANFQPDGLTLMAADLVSPAAVYYNVSLISATTTRFNGSVTVFANATTATPWKLNVTTKEGGRTSRPSAITIQSYPCTDVHIHHSRQRF